MVVHGEKQTVLITASTFPRWKDDTEPAFIFNLAKNLQKYQEAFRIITLAPHYPGAHKEEMLDGVKVYRYQYFFSRWERLCAGGMLSNIRKNFFLIFLVPFLIFFQVVALRKIVKKEHVDIIHANWIFPQGLAAVLYKLCIHRQIRIVITVHGGDVYSLTQHVFLLVKRFVLHHSNAWNAVSDLSRIEMVRQVGTNVPSHRIYNGIDTDQFCHDAAHASLKERYQISAECILFVGRLVEKKGVTYLIKAFAQILSRYPHATLLVVGSGVLYDVLQKQSYTLGIDRTIRFVGGVPNSELPAYYTCADLVVCPSIIGSDRDTEGMPVVISEALSCGVPVITTPVGGIPDVIRDRYTGLLVPPGNHEALANAMMQVLGDSRLREQLSRNGRAFVEREFRWETIVPQYVSLYQQYLKKDTKKI